MINQTLIAFARILAAAQSLSATRWAGVEHELPRYFKDFGSIPGDWYHQVFRFDWLGSPLEQKFLMLLSALGIVCVIYLLLTLRKSISNIKNTGLSRVFIFTWIYGVLVYDIGMYNEGTSFSFITNLPLAVLYGFKIFLLDSDVSEIHTGFHENWLFSGNFALVHFLAACVTTLFVIKHFGFNLMSRYRMWRAGLPGARRVDDTYVFWGLNDAGCRLIESINEHYGANPNYRIIVIRTNSGDDDAPEGRTGFNRILDFLSMKNSELDRISRLGCLTTGTYARISEVELADHSHEPCDVLGEKLGLKSLRRLLTDKTAHRIHMLFLSADSDANLHDVSLLVRDKTIDDFISADKNHRRVIFYCHARYNSVHRVIEDQHLSENLTVQVVDSSHICVEMLKQDKLAKKELLPVSHVNVREDATVDTPFHAMVVGFREVGLDSVRFLYEFGAFVKTGSTDTHVERSDFHIDVVDRDMADLAGTFVANAPAIRPSIPFVEGMERPDALITLHQMDCRSVEFYRQLKSWITTLNYVVIATDDDELNMSTAIRIFRAAIRYRDNMDKLSILVRVHSDKDHRYRSIAEHYNRLWAAQQSTPVGEKFHQKSVKRDDTITKPLVIFGLEEEVYTYANIIDDSTERRAIDFKEIYEASSNPKHKYSKEDKDKAWYIDFRRKMQLEGEFEGFAPTYAALMNLRRTRGQDMANSLHAYTKAYLRDEALRAIGIKTFGWRLLTRRNKTVVYTHSAGLTIDPRIVRILNVLAQTEHLRWNASHQLLGYICRGTDGSKDEIRLHHADLTDWHRLKPETQGYDYNVVDVTLGIIDPERPLKE